MRLSAYGNTVSEPIGLLAAFDNYATGNADMTAGTTVNTEADGWRYLGSRGSGNHVNSNRLVRAIVALPNLDGDDQFDLAAVRLAATYYVLQ